MWRLLVAFVAGLGSFVPYMFVGESVGDGAAFAVIAAYYFLGQFFLSHGHERALVRDWGLMLALDASNFMLAVIAQAPRLPLLSCTVGGTVAGALAATLAARSGRPGLRGAGPIPAALVAGAGALALGFTGLALFAMIGGALERGLHLDGMMKAGAAAGLALGIAVGAHVANRGRGRLGLVLGCSLAIGAAAWLVSIIPATIPAPGENGWIQVAILGVSLVAELLVAVRIETATAAHASAATA